MIRKDWQHLTLLVKPKEAAHKPGISTRRIYISAYIRPHGPRLWPKKKKKALKKKIWPGGIPEFFKGSESRKRGSESLELTPKISDP